MDAHGDGLVSRPRSIKELSDAANEFNWDSRIPFKYWIRAAETIYREAINYEREGNYGRAYIFYLRHSILVIDKLGTHPNAKDPENKAALRPLLKRMPTVLKDLERLKPPIEAAYREWQKAKASHRESEDPRGQSKYHSHAANDPALSWNTATKARVLDARQHSDVAVTLAKQEIRRRDTVRKASRGIPGEEEKTRRSAGVWDSWDVRAETSVQEPESTVDEDMRKYMEDARRMTMPGGWNGHSREDDGQLRRPSQHPLGPRQPPSHSYNYPSILTSKPITYDRDSTPRDRVMMPPPPRPLKEAMAPSPPPYAPLSEPIPRYGSAKPEPAPQLPPKIPDVAPKKERTVFQPAAYLENGEPLRTVFLPANLRKTFLGIAADNTRRGLEMCGILCGTPVNNALFISCLLIPEQKCTSDTCETENESSMLEFCINQDLLVLGWIHTHPTQTCFMSSRDLHTQAGYQVMMPEALAIVCAPRHDPSHGIFRLTHPPGLNHILECTHTATFHQHSIDNIYTDAQNPPGHVIEHRDMDFTVQDLRPKR